MSTELHVKHIHTRLNIYNRFKEQNTENVKIINSDTCMYIHQKKENFIKLCIQEIEIRDGKLKH